MTVTGTQAQEINKAVKKQHIDRVKQKYNMAVGAKKKFDDIPAEAQTVIASVSFQYGDGLAIRAPKFWKAVTSQDWKESIKLLNSFGDAYPTRRKKEAALLGKVK